MKLTVANTNVTNTLSTASITLANNNIVDSISLGNVSVTPSQITVGSATITPTAVSVPSLILGGGQFSVGQQGGIINYQEFTANGTWLNPYYYFSGFSYSQGLTYTYYIQGTATNPTTEAGFNALFNTATVSPTVTFGGTGLHSGTINWGDAGQTGAAGVVGPKPAYLPADAFSWAVEGYIYAPETGTYTFGFDSDDGADIFVNNVNVTNAYVGRGMAGTWTTGNISLTANTYYTFRARMQEGSVNDGMQVGWKKPSDASVALIPANAFFIQSNTYSTNSLLTGYTGYEQVLVMAWGGGGGGSLFHHGGGGACIIGNAPISAFSDTCSVTVGLGGTAGTNTTSGGVGGTTTFVINATASLVAYGGGGASNTVGGSGGGLFSAGGTGTAGGSPLGGAAGTTAGDSTFGGGGAQTGTPFIGGSSIFGGGAGGPYKAYLSSVYGGGGGGADPASPPLTIFGGQGSKGYSTLSITAPTTPGGGGGSNNTSRVAGARGEVRVWVFGPAGTTAGAPTYSLTANTTSVYGGDSILYTISTTNVSNGTSLYYTLNNSSTAVATDFTTAVNGSVVITGGIGTFSLTANSKTFASNTGITFDIRSGSTTGPIVVANNSTLIRKTPTLTFLSHNHQDGLTAYTDVTISGASLGTAAADRKIVVSVLGYNMTEPITCTIAGVPATLAHSIVNISSSPWWDNYVFIADVPTGTTGDILITDVVAQYGSYSAAVYALYGAESSTPVATATSETNNSTTLNNSLTNLRNSCVILTSTGHYLSNITNPMSITTNDPNAVVTTNVDGVKIDTQYFFLVEYATITNNYVSSATCTSTFGSATTAISSSVAFR